jgi:Tfp pilus assembly protein PilP
MKFLPRAFKMSLASALLGAVWAQDASATLMAKPVTPPTQSPAQLQADEQGQPQAPSQEILQAQAMVQAAQAKTQAQAQNQAQSKTPSIPPASVGQPQSGMTGVHRAENSSERFSLRALKDMRDPFKRLDSDSPTGALEKPKSELENVPVTEFKMVGVLTGPHKTRALIRAPSGAVYPVSDGTKIGVQNGYVRKVLSDRIIINEVLQDVLGERELVTSELKLSTKGVEKGVSNVQVISTSTESSGNRAWSSDASVTQVDEPVIPVSKSLSAPKGNLYPMQAPNTSAPSTTAPSSGGASTSGSINMNSPSTGTGTSSGSSTTNSGANFNSSVPAPVTAPKQGAVTGYSTNPAQSTAGSK